MGWLTRNRLYCLNCISVYISTDGELTPPGTQESSPDHLAACNLLASGPSASVSQLGPPQGSASQLWCRYSHSRSQDTKTLCGSILRLYGSSQRLNLSKAQADSEAGLETLDPSCKRPRSLSECLQKLFSFPPLHARYLGPCRLWYH